MRWILLLALLLPALVATTGCGSETEDLGRPAPPPVATFSIVARDPATGDLGIAVQSRFLAVGWVVPEARADVGALATQSFANTAWRHEALALLDGGVAPQQAIEQLTAADPQRARRQLGLVDAQGRAAAFTGTACMPWAGQEVGEGFCCQGNLLAGPEVVRAMAKTYASGTLDFPERLVAALAAGQAEGGDKRGRQSAALLVVRRGGGYGSGDDRYIDLRVDDHPKPIEELARLLAMRRRFRVADAPRSKRPQGIVREPRVAAQGTSTPRDTWHRLQRAMARGDGEAVLGAFRGSLTLSDPEARAKAAAALLAADSAWRRLLEQGRYVGTAYGEKDGAQLHLWLPGGTGTRKVPFLRVGRRWLISE